MQPNKLSEKLKLKDITKPITFDDLLVQAILGRAV